MDAEYPPIGTVAVLRFWFKGPDGELGDPDSVTARVLKPDGSFDTLSGMNVVKIDVGIYDVSVTLDQSGLWLITGVGIGGITAASSDIPITVQSSRTIAA